MTKPINWKNITGDNGQGQFRYDFEKKFSIDPLDYSLACLSTDDIPTKILQTYVRFYKIGWIHEYGNQCFLMSHLLRRVLRLHGIEAHTKQMTLEYKNDDRGWFQEVGVPSNITHEGEIDTHMVVVTKDLILDFSIRNSIHWAFGAMAPLGIIVKNDPSLYGEHQNTGFFGLVSYAPRTHHRLTKNVVFEQRDLERDLVKSYFKTFRI